MKKLLVYLKDYKKESILGPLFKLLEASFELIVPLVVASMIDVGIANNDKGYVGKMCLIMAVLGFTGLISAVTAQYFAAKAAVGFATKLRHGLFAHIESLSFTNMDKQGTSTLITRMTSDINQVQSGVNLVLRLFLRSPFIVFGAMVMAFTVDVKAALIFVVVIPLLSVVVFGVMLASIPLFDKVQKNLDKVLGTTRENLTGVRVIRAFGKEENEVEKFDGQTDSLRKIQMTAARISALMNPFTYIIINGGLIMLIYTGALRVELGILTQGQVVALVNYMSQILVELVKLANLIITVTKAVACGNRVQSVFEIPAGMEGKTGNPARQTEQGRVDFEGVSMKYHEGGEEALTDITFHAQKGDTIGVIGGTGSGKTSLVHLIPRFYDVTGGELLIDGVNVKEVSQKELRDIIGFVPQKGILFSGTIESNIKYANEAMSDEQMKEAAEIAQAIEFIEEKDKKYQEPIAQGGSNVSGGQKQRLSIARAIAKNPEIFVFDDSFSALDFKTDSKLREALASKTKNKTVIIVAQRISTILNAEKIVVLEEGKVVGIGTHEELMKDNETYQQIALSQLSEEELDKKGGE